VVFGRSLVKLLTTRFGALIDLQQVSDDGFWFRSGEFFKSLCLVIVGFFCSLGSYLCFVRHGQ